MANLKKSVQFALFRPYFLRKDENGVSQEHLYDLRALLQHVSSHSFSETKKKISGETHMFHVCRRDNDLSVWELQILHLREKSLPGIADEDGSYELITLGDHQFPAESTTLLYDEKEYTLYIQRNIYGTSIKALEEFLQLISPEGTSVLLKPIITGQRIKRINPSIFYRKVVLTADSQLLSEEHESSSLAKIIKSFRQYQGRIVKVELGFGRQRHGFLNATEVTQLVHEAYNFPGTNHLDVNISDDEDTPFETINLLDDLAKYRLTVEYSRNNPITHDRLFRMCLAEYKEKHGLL